MDNFQAIGEKFCLNGNVISVMQLTGGNINRTFKVSYSDGKHYIFQNVNTSVFKDPIAVMNNIDIVTEHIRNKKLYGLHFHHTEERNNYVYMEDGSFWRVINYIESITFDTCDDLNVIEKVGCALAEFQERLSDLDCSSIVETIPDFHNTRKRLDTLFLHKEKNAEIDYIKSVKDDAVVVYDAFENGKIPTRVTHNDTKANNILFDKDTKEPIVIIDLDTVMPGIGLNDFADASRFICNDTTEDGPVDSVNFNVEKFEAICKGYIPIAKKILNETEINFLVESVFAITVELASRFLDDYLNGNKYFKCLYKEHNLVRARNQIALAKDIKYKERQLKEIVSKVLKNC